MKFASLQTCNSYSGHSIFSFAIKYERKPNLISLVYSLPRVVSLPDDFRNLSQIRDGHPRRYPIAIYGGVSAERIAPLYLEVLNILKPRQFFSAIKQDLHNSQSRASPLINRFELATPIQGEQGETPNDVSLENAAEAGFYDTFEETPLALVVNDPETDKQT
jgi:hypothetical protein